MYKIFMSDFFWKSRLEIKRREDIVAWVNSLPENNRKMIDELMYDTRQSQSWIDNSDT